MESRTTTGSGLGIADDTHECGAWIGSARLTANTRLQLAPGIRTRFDARGHVLVTSPEGSILDIGPRGFDVLSLFSQPLELADVIDRLEADASRANNLLPTLSVVNALLEEGVLIEPSAGWEPRSGWADPVEHARMLHDSRRTRDYMAAITAAVRPDDVVLDIGTGSGVLAVAAARAGARHVYAVEASDIAQVAARVFAANGVEDKVTLIDGWSRHVTLPEPADLLVSEVIGSEPFEEEILETTLDARLRLLKPSARLIPNALTLLARPLLIPEHDARQHTIGHDDVERWGRLYDIDFEPLRDAAIPAPAYAPLDGEVVSRAVPVGPPVVLTSVDLTAFETVSIDAHADLAVDPPGTVNAVAITFRADLHGAIAHTLDPWTWPASSWATPVWVFPDPIRVDPGAVLHLRFSRRLPEAPDGLRCELRRDTPKQIHDERRGARDGTRTS